MFSINIDKLMNMTQNESESYNELADVIINKYAKCTTLAITGGGVEAFKLAGIIANESKKILFVDADFSSEVFLGKYKLGKNLKGLYQYTKNQNELKSIVCMTNNNNVNVVFTGVNDNDINTEEKAQLIHGILDEAKLLYDLVIVHYEKDTAVAECCDGTILIVSEDDYNKDLSDQMVNELSDQGCKVLGVIINE